MRKINNNKVREIIMDSKRMRELQNSNLKIKNLKKILYGKNKK